ncbi:hypothetical protein N658DRAFT_251270 [Parathielavia hyrcaniae]|uniref:Uncharacterized protein n=1 Tax=Parathielavia hyrcaniae TaxID=113614 RepID=A0AAN6QBD0_9PEZI|nr:hypothetical protein N658DRAFT_251270 [Parathielavia hyrcaniae]
MRLRRLARRRGSGAGIHALVPCACARRASAQLTCWPWYSVLISRTVTSTLHMRHVPPSCSRIFSLPHKLALSACLFWRVSSVAFCLTFHARNPAGQRIASWVPAS